MISRRHFSLGLVVVALLLSFTSSEGQVPHTIIGQVFNSDTTSPAAGELSFQAHLVDVSNNNAHSETRSQEDPGNAYGDGIMGSGWFEVECGNFTAFDWSSGDSLVVQFSNSANGQVGHLAIALSSIQEPQLADDVILHEAMPGWSLSMEGDPDTVWAGDNLVYTIVYHNIGQGEASGVTILDTIPAHTSYHSNTGGGSHQSRVVTWSLGSAPPGDSGSVTLTVTVDSPLANGTNISNAINISCNEGVGADAEETTTVESAPAWNFNILDSPDPVNAGDFLAYTILYGNTGSDQATGVTIVDTIPANSSYFSNTGGGSFDGQRVIWTLGSVPAESQDSVTLTVTVDWPLPNGTQIEDAAHIDCDQGIEAASGQTTTVSPDLISPNPVTDLTTSRDGDEVHLSWSPIITDIHGDPEAMDGYIVYRNEAPYFAPTSLDSIGVVSDTFFNDDESGAGETEVNTFYALQGVDHAGNISAPSNRAGEIDYSLPSAGAGYAMISLSLDDGVTALATELGAKVSNCTAVKVWDAAEHGYISRAFKVDDTWYGSATVSLGYPYYLFIGSPAESTWILCGRVPPDPIFQLLAPTGNDYNTITLPLSSDIVKAKDLGAAIPSCTAVKRWDEEAQGYVSIAFKIDETWFGEAPVKRGYPYYVNVTENTLWPSGQKAGATALAGRRS
jgi:uncharacterized repeat protein (TIGR01451 family)